MPALNSLCSAQSTSVIGSAAKASNFYWAEDAKTSLEISRGALD